MATSALKASHIVRRFDSKTVLKDVTLDIEPGEHVSLVGSNGSGKTTLLRIFSTLLAPTSGGAWVCGFPVSNERSVRSKIGWVPATDIGFVPRFTGRENLGLFGSLLGLSSSEISRRIDLWRDFEPLNTALQTPHYLSSAGMKQALSIARALLSDPEVLLFDEPVRSLDETAQSTLKAFFKGPLRNKTILFSGHEETAIQKLSDRTLHLSDGAIL